MNDARRTSAVPARLAGAFLGLEAVAGALALGTGFATQAPGSSIVGATLRGIGPTLITAGAISVAALAGGLACGFVAARVTKKLGDRLLERAVELAATLPLAALLPCAAGLGAPHPLVVGAVLSTFQMVWIGRLVRGELMKLEERQRLLELGARRRRAWSLAAAGWRAVLGPLPLAGALVFAEVCGLDAALSVTEIGPLFPVPTLGSALSSVLARAQAAHLLPAALIVATTLAGYVVLEELSARLKRPRRSSSAPEHALARSEARG